MKKGGRPSVELKEIPVSRIRVDYIRDVGSFADVDALVASILEIGLVEPIVLETDSQHKGYYILIAGYRRLRAYISANIYKASMDPKAKVPKNWNLNERIRHFAEGMTILAVVKERAENGWSDKARRAENLARKDYTQGEKRRLASGRTQEPYYSSVIEFRERRLQPPEEPDQDALYDPLGHVRKAFQRYAERDSAFMNRSDTNPKIWFYGMNCFTEIQDEIRRFQKNEDGGQAS